MMSSKSRMMILVFFTVTLFKVHAFSFTSDFNQGSFWPSFPLEIVNIKKSSDQVVNEVFFELLKRAEQEWEDSIGIDIWNFKQHETNTQISNYIVWSDNFYEDTGFDATSTLAVTSRYTENGVLVAMAIVLNGEIDYLKANRTGTLYKTILHELGHTIGLDHSDEEAIMQASLGEVTNLQLDDVAGGVEVINITQDRQISSNYLSGNGLLNDDQLYVAACGSVIFKDGDDDKRDGMKLFVLLMVMISFFIPLFLTSFQKGMTAEEYFAA